MNLSLLVGVGVVTWCVKLAWYTRTKSPGILGRKSAGIPSQKWYGIPYQSGTVYYNKSASIRAQMLVSEGHMIPRASILARASIPASQRC